MELLDRFALRGFGVLAIATGAAAWVIYGGAPTARAIRLVFGALDPVVVLEVAAALVVVGLASRLSGRRLELGRRLPSVPTAIALAAIVALAAVFRVVLGADRQLPTVFGDELIYSGLAKGWALHGEPILRGNVDVGYSFLYPLFVAPGFRLAADGADGLAALRALNAVAMAFTAIPAFLFARRVLPRAWALGVAALAVAVPWTAYAALAMTESLFYPVFVAYAATLAWTLDRPTWRRQALLLALLVVVVGVRTQGLVVVPGTVLAMFVSGGVRRFLPTFGLLAVAVVAALLARGAGAPLPTSTYHPVFDSLSRVGGMLKWAAWSVASFELALGVVAVAAFPLALRAMLRGGARSTAAAALGLSVALLASVALLSASPYGLDRLHERNLFYVTPLLLTCFAYWLWRGLERPRGLAVACGLAAVVLAALLPGDVVFQSFDVDVPSSAFFRGLEHDVPGVDFRSWALVLATVGAGTLLLARRAVFPLLTVVLAFAAVTARVDYRDALTEEQARAISWLDRSLPKGESATLVHLGVPYGLEPCASAAWWEEQHLFIWTEWFNGRVETVKYLYEPNRFDGVPAGELTVGQGGLVLDGGRPFAPRYAVIDSRQPVTGTRVGRFDLDSIQSEYRNGASLTLWRIDPPFRLYSAPLPLPPRGDGRPC